MNKSLIIALLLILTAGVVAVADDMDRYIPPGPDGRIPIPPAYISGLTSATISPEEARTQQIREWAASGEVCRVLGRHSWDKIPMYDGPAWNVRRSGTLFRCSICGKTETKKEVWE